MPSPVNPDPIRFAYWVPNPYDYNRELEAKLPERELAGAGR